MLALLGILGYVGTIICGIWVIVLAVKKKPKKKQVIALCICAVVWGAIGAITTGSSPSQPEPPSSHSESAPAVSEAPIDSSPSSESVSIPTKDEAAATFSEIRAAYKANELSFNDTYKGNRYTIYGMVNGMTEGGLTNSLFNTATFTIEVNDAGTKCFVYAVFNKDQRDALKTYNVGDEISFTGTCVDWGNWEDCVINK